MDVNYKTATTGVVLEDIIRGHEVVFREYYFNSPLQDHSVPGHICAYVRLIPPFRCNDEYEYSNETYREDDVFGVDTAHFYNRNMDMNQKLDDAKRQITELIEEHITWQAEQNITQDESVSEPEPKPPVKQQPICVRRFMNLEL